MIKDWFGSAQFLHPDAVHAVAVIVIGSPRMLLTYSGKNQVMFDLQPKGVWSFHGLDGHQSYYYFLNVGLLAWVTRSMLYWWLFHQWLVFSWQKWLILAPQEVGIPKARWWKKRDSLEVMRGVRRWGLEADDIEGKWIAACFWLMGFIADAFRQKVMCWNKVHNDFFLRRSLVHLWNSVDYGQKRSSFNQC